MKALLLTALLATSATATETKDPKSTFCENYATAAHGVMKARQNGAPLSKVIQIGPIIKELALIAYDTPKYSHDKYKENAITEFENKILLACLKGSTKG